MWHHWTVCCCTPCETFSDNNSPNQRVRGHGCWQRSVDLSPKKKRSPITRGIVQPPYVKKCFQETKWEQKLSKESNEQNELSKGLPEWLLKWSLRTHFFHFECSLESLWFLKSKSHWNMSILNVIFRRRHSCDEDDFLLLEKRSESSLGFHWLLKRLLKVSWQPITDKSAFKSLLPV